MTSIESAAKTCIPDVFIAGGMKCGSSSLHRSLSRHPDVWMPEDEQYLMDFDDTNVHPEFVDSHGSDRPERDALRYICSAYQARFTTSAPVIGERSTTYLYSLKTPPRITRLRPDPESLFSCVIP